MIENKKLDETAALALGVVHGNRVLDSRSCAPADADESYEIKVKGHLEEHWSEWLGGLKIIHDSQGNSLLAGAVPDQASLHGILAQIRDLGLPLIYLVRRAVDANEGEINEQRKRSVRI